jgi:hypothetical protein
LLARYPDLVVVDGRSSGYPEGAFGDAFHLNRRGALAYTGGLAEIVERALAEPSRVSGWVALPAYREMSTTVQVEDLDESRRAVLRAAGVDRVLR